MSSTNSPLYAHNNRNNILLFYMRRFHASHNTTDDVDKLGYYMLRT